MDIRSPRPREVEASVHLQINEQINPSMQLSDNWGSTIFDPQRGMSGTIEQNDGSENSASAEKKTDLAPEKKLTLFALQLAILEKSASGLGTLGFIWATVVLLGGFAITLDKTDFWLITIILLVEGTRIFSRSHELEWQHQATWSITDAGRFSFQALKSSSNKLLRNIKAIFQPEAHSNRGLTENGHREVSRNQNNSTSASRTWPTPDVPLLPYTGWIFLSKNISKLLYWLQLLSASSCVLLSLIRLIQQDYGEISKGETDKRNRKAALDIFYSLALAEALLFLMERAYWEWKISYHKLLEEVNNECEFGKSGMVSIKRFFYDSYSRCVNGSIFDGLKMDLVSFAVELLASNSSDEQLNGAQILRKFVTSKRFSDDTLRKIGTATPS